MLSFLPARSGAKVTGFAWLGLSASILAENLPNSSRHLQPMMKLIYSYLKTTRMFYPSASIISDIFPSWQDGIFQKQIRKHWPRNINAVKDSWIYPENMGWVVLRYSAY